jgi:ubiquinone/menaquinone biosynthesis C-methylase UbiE
MPQLALFSDGSEDAAESAGGSTGAYERRYQDFERARSYNLKYERELFKRLSTRREHRLLKRLLDRAGRCATLLEIPCGGGRISGQLSGAANLLIHADIGLGQVLFAESRAEQGQPRVWMTASALHIPLRDAAVDGAVCIRLSHHLAAADQRERLLLELLRVARRYVIFTFFDQHAVKNQLRQWRGKRSKLTMTVPQVTDLAAACGARLAVCSWISRLASGHRYALLLKQSGGASGR